MAPELFQDISAHTIASDIWAFGCILYHCLFGRPPFMETTFSKLVNAILNEMPEPLKSPNTANDSSLIDLLSG